MTKCTAWRHSPPLICLHGKSIPVLIQRAAFSRVNNLNCSSDCPTGKQLNRKQRLEFTIHCLASVFGGWEVPMCWADIFPISSGRGGGIQRECQCVHLMNEIIHRQLIRVSLSHSARVPLSHCVPWHAKAKTTTKKVT